MFDFRSIILALRPYISDTYHLTDAADAVVALDSPQGNQQEFGHNALVAAALRDGETVGHMLSNRKISAIKRHRLLTGCGLKESKDAVEDSLMTAHIAGIRTALADAESRRF